VGADLSAEAMQPRIRAVPVSEMLAAIDEQYRANAESKGLALRVIRSSLVLSTDPGALIAMIGNLVSNAIAYTVSGRVVVGCRRAGAKCRIEGTTQAPAFRRKIAPRSIPRTSSSRTCSCRERRA